MLCMVHSYKLNSCFLLIYLLPIRSINKVYDDLFQSFLYDIFFTWVGMLEIINSAVEGIKAKQWAISELQCPPVQSELLDIISSLLPHR